MPGFEPGSHWWEASAVNIYMFMGKLPKNYGQTGNKNVQLGPPVFSAMSQNKSADKFHVFVARFIVPSSGHLTRTPLASGRIGEQSS